MAQRPRPAEVVPLFRPLADDVAEEVTVGRPIMPVTETVLVATQTAIDLSDRAKIVMAIGNGNTSKTTAMRYFAETMLSRGSQAIFAAVDPENRELRDYFEAVHEPPSYDPAKVAKWLENLFAHAMETKASACIDFGGGDTTLGRLVADSPDLVSVLGTLASRP
jgi:hypothetical protein